MEGDRESARSGRSVVRRTLRGLGFAALGISIMSGVALVAASVYRRALAERLIAEGLALLEIELGAITVERFEPSHIAVTGLQILHPVDLAIDRLEAHYSWSSLEAERLESLDAHGIRIRTELSEHVSPGPGKAAGAPPRIAAPTAEAVPTSSFREELLAALLAFPALPARRFDLTGLQIEVATPEDTYRMEGEFHATQTDDRLDAQARIAIRAPIEIVAGFRVLGPIDLDVVLAAKSGEVRAALAPTAMKIQIQGDEPVVIDVDTPAIDVRLAAAGSETAPRIEIKSEGGRVSAPAFDIEASGFALSTAFASKGLPRNVDLRVAQLKDLKRPARVPPVSLSASVTLGQDRQKFQLTLREGGDRAELGARGYHDIAKGRGRAEFHLLPISFAEEGLQPAALVRALADSISKVAGNVEVLGNVSWAGATGGSNAPLELRAGVDIALRDVALTTPLASFRGINSVVHVDGPWPPSTPPAQRLQIGLIDVGVAVTDTTASFQLHEDLTLTLEEAVLHFAGGELRTAGLLDLSAPEQELTLEVSGIDLEALFSLVDMEGLSGRGTLSGSIPVLRTSDAIEIRDGELANLHDDGERRLPGWIRYRPSSGVEAAASGQTEFGKALEALENFHYEEFDIELNGGLDGTIELSLHLVGSNPDFHDGYPVNFNLNLEAPLGSLLEGASYTQQLVEKIERDLSAFGSKAANFRETDASTTGEEIVAPPRTDR